MKTSQENKEKELKSRNAHLISEGSRKWLLYLIGDRDPLLGFVHAATKAEALERVAKFGRKVVAVEANAPALAETEPMTPERIAKEFAFFGTVIPAYSEEAHRRTAYFYKREAIAWAREARASQAWPILPRPAAIRLAKSYLSNYRMAKAMAL